MTKKVYRTAQGKTVDMGALILQNENTRAVGNMNVNARGDRLDSSNNVIDQKNRQIQRQHNRTSNMSDVPVHESTRDAKASQTLKADTVTAVPADITVISAPTPVPEISVPVPATQVADTPAEEGGLAAAIARSKASKTK